MNATKSAHRLHLRDLEFRVWWAGQELEQAKEFIAKLNDPNLKFAYRDGEIVPAVRGDGSVIED